jgi:hypothetical protein
MIRIRRSTKLGVVAGSAADPVEKLLVREHLRIVLIPAGGYREVLRIEDHPARHRRARFQFFAAGMVAREPTRP